MGSGMDPADCNAMAEVAPGEWLPCIYWAGHEAPWKHNPHGHRVEVPSAYNPGRTNHIDWQGGPDSRLRLDGSEYDGRMALAIMDAVRELSSVHRVTTEKILALPDPTRELVIDAKRKLRDAYKALTGVELDAETGLRRETEPKLRRVKKKEPQSRD